MKHANGKLGVAFRFIFCSFAMMPYLVLVSVLAFSQVTSFKPSAWIKTKCMTFLPSDATKYHIIFNCDKRYYSILFYHHQTIVMHISVLFHSVLFCSVFGVQFNSASILHSWTCVLEDAQAFFTLKSHSCIRHILRITYYNCISTIYFRFSYSIYSAMILICK